MMKIVNRKVSLEPIKSTFAYEKCSKKLQELFDKKIMQIEKYSDDGDHFGFLSYLCSAGAISIKVLLNKFAESFELLQTYFTISESKYLQIKYFQSIVWRKIS